VYRTASPSFSAVKIKLEASAQFTIKRNVKPLSEYQQKDKRAIVDREFEAE